MELVKLLREGKLHEGLFSYRKRIQQSKRMIAEYRKKYNRVAIVSHYYTIEYLGAVSYKSCGTPSYYIDIKNCKPYFANLANMLAHKAE